MAQLARKKNVTSAQIALAWVIAQGGVSAPLLGATRLQHIANAVAAADLHLTTAEQEQLDAHYRPHAVLGHD